MANGHVEIHDPIPNHSDLTTTTSANGDPKATSNTDSMEDTVELKILMAYAKRRRPAKRNSTTKDISAAPGEPSPPLAGKNEEEEVKKKRKGWKRMLRRLSCFSAQRENIDLPEMMYKCDDDCRGFVIKQDDSRLAALASKLIGIADDIPFTPPDVEADSDEDEVEKVIGLLLREAGDQLNEQLRDAHIATELFWNYGFFERLVQTFLVRIGLVNSQPNSLGPQASPESQIAVTCEVTSRLSAVETLPMSRMLDHGARYLRDHYSSWAQQQGGYEEAFYSDEEDEDQ